MNFIHYGKRIEIERQFLEWCKKEGVSNKPNSFVALMMLKDWLNGEKIIKDLDDHNAKERAERKKKMVITFEIERDSALSIADAIIERETNVAVTDELKQVARERIRQTGQSLINYVDSCERIDEWVERSKE